MEHLSDDEIFDFITLTDLNDQSMKLIHRVNTHIFKCDECREKVVAFQSMSDQLSRQASTKEIIKEKLKAALHL